MSAIDRIIPVVGVVGTVLGLASLFLPWCTHGGLAYTGLDFITGSTPFQGFQMYLPAVCAVFMVIGLIFSVKAVFDKRKGFSSYFILLVGFVALGISVVFGNWVPEEGLKLITSGGFGQYLMYAACSLYIVYGIIEYTYR